jgi:phosphoglucosamine mutase
MGNIYLCKKSPYATISEKGVIDVRRLFGTDGVRGVANRDLTAELAYQLGFAAACVLGKIHTERAFFVIGKDTRISGDMLEAALIAGIMAAGVDVHLLGIIPTPGVAYLTRNSHAAAGVMISASHNPVEDNGIKFFGADGYKLIDAMEDEIERTMEQLNECERPISSAVGKRTEHGLGTADYAAFLKSTVKHRLDGVKVAVDAANGAAYDLAKEVLASLGAEVFAFADRADGALINVNCGSTHPDFIAAKVKELGADVGLAFDGDADRLIAVDEHGEIVDGDRMMLICGRHLQAKGELRGHTVVSTVMSNYGFVKAAKELGIELVRTAVGDRYVMEAMREGGFILGGEQSGHVIFLNYNTTGDGILTALQLLSVVVESKQPLSELAAVMRSYPQVLVNVRVMDKTAWRQNDAIAEAIRVVEEKLGEDGRILVRESGTEPIVRVMAEGSDEATVRGYVNDIVAVVHRELG